MIGVVGFFMKPTIVIKIKHGRVIGITSSKEIFADVEIHDLDSQPALDQEHPQPIEIEFFEKICREKS